MGLVDKVCDDETDVHLAAWEFLAPFLRHTTGGLSFVYVLPLSFPFSLLASLP